MSHSIVYVTAPDRPTAARLARSMVESRLAACANILPRIDSVYWWEGRLETAKETAILLKTRTRLVHRLTTELCRLHPYECPCVVAMPIVAGNPRFLRWIDAETRPAPRRRPTRRSDTTKPERPSR